MLQRKPLKEWTSKDLEKWRERLSRLLVLVGKVGDTEEAWQVYYQYRDGEIRYEEAKQSLMKLTMKSS